jgi:nucleoside-diphosphate-sugar epimerase
MTSVSELVREAATGRITLTGNRGSVRNYCCAVDFAQGLVLAAVLAPAGRAYNIGSEEHLTTEELARTIAASFGKVEITGPVDAAPASYQRLDIARARAELGFAPTLRLAELLPALAAELRAGA